MHKSSQVLLKTWTTVESSGQNDDNDRNTKEFYDYCIRWDGFKPWMLRIRNLHACLIPWEQNKEH